jgi:DNA polymerase V
LSVKEIRNHMVPNHSPYKIPLAPSPICAGNGVFIHDSIDLNSMVTRGLVGRHLAYEVTGSSCEPLIAPGSIVIVNRFREPVNGDTVAVLLNDYAFVKVFERKEQRLRLVSPNPDFTSEEVREYDDFVLLGVVEWAFTPVSPEVRQARLTDMDRKILQFTGAI